VQAEAEAREQAVAADASAGDKGSSKGGAESDGEGADLQVLVHPPLPMADLHCCTFQAACFAKMRPDCECPEGQSC
jgi:hypothetical protein